jgi:hypothetical protein
MYLLKLARVAMFIVLLFELKSKRRGRMRDVTLIFCIVTILPRIWWRSTQIYQGIAAYRRQMKMQAEDAKH